MPVNCPRLWAPRAHDVALDVDGARHPMVRQGDWWGAGVTLPVGARYGFVVDGGSPVPDPRSRSQPDGVHGQSEVVTLSTPPPFIGPALADSVFYELHVGTFSAAGTFAGAIDHLDHLVRLGVTTVELMPVAAFPGSRGWGYDGVDLFAPQHGYGGPQGLRALVDACHAHGLAIVLDVVYNHLGPDGNYLPSLGPYFTDAHTTPWGPAINLDHRGCEEVRAFIVDNALMWLRDYGFDGLRLDAVHALHDDSGRHVLADLAAAVDALPTPKLLVAESETLNPRLRDYGLSGQWFDQFHHALHALLTGETNGYYRGFGTIDRLADALRATAVPREHLVGFAQNHDQIGNRARGERLCHLVNEPRQRIAAALTLLGPFTPLVFMGEEWAATSPFQYFTDHQDPALADAVRNGRRDEFAAFGWRADEIPDPQAEETYRRSMLVWDEADQAPHRGTLAFYRDLLALRRERPSLRTGDAHIRQSGTSGIEMRRDGVTVFVDLANDALDIRP